MYQNHISKSPKQLQSNNKSIAPSLTWWEIKTQLKHNAEQLNILKHILKTKLKLNKNHAFVN